ncbi:hypothetical protein MAPG_11454 [Magnaporthiopsis poae ATCC 64411]|uniref:Uncharacterized protein n=1 Tax=Magnaporthiopsis poae (strain ATCC 64411 / 73-15) TaxID=644358 RepID=A0A0C4EFB4_MAGP6|nr:hypothetical protein MAPG_11454 [Magnaporthiopsis poae ATCC 64411]
MANQSRMQKSSVKILDDHHREILCRAISNVLSTQAAETAYAQVVDGLPLRDVAVVRHPRMISLHPISNCHYQLCPGVVEKVQEFRDGFSPEALTFESMVLLAYQAAGPKSKAFGTRLIELVALAVHQVAVLLFNLDTSLHKGDGITEWAPSKDDWLFWEKHPNGPLPTLLHHQWYTDFEQYPEGVADMVGFWAESQILGGVVLFDRRPKDIGGEADAVYWHPGRRDATYRICKLLPDQKQKLLDFLIATEPQEAPPLPLLPGGENLIRVDPEEPIAETGIFRHIWERKEPPLSTAIDARMKDVLDPGDFPTVADWRAAAARGWARKRKAERAYDLEMTAREKAAGRKPEGREMVYRERPADSY